MENGKEIYQPAAIKVFNVRTRRVLAASTSANENSYLDGVAGAEE